ncbi:hypothetical protein TIFTF001_016600 [Ficus carica]|uniref:Uncharacterized protein n=1 Tax=Ficus carica TaxID=3494 RepID=A0AA88AJV0_FICCA|nr:hypothetical protein TIFTF001_016600 [Ficus carica]
MDKFRSTHVLPQAPTSTGVAILLRRRGLFQTTLLISSATRGSRSSVTVTVAIVVNSLSCRRCEIAGQDVSTSSSTPTLLKVRVAVGNHAGVVGNHVGRHSRNCKLRQK